VRCERWLSWCPCWADCRTILANGEEERLEYQADLFESAVARRELDELFEQSRLYKSSSEYLELLQFVGRLRQFAPFNAMLLQVQKPGLTHAATSKEWAAYGRFIKQHARPLIILWPFGPVSLVYDIQDTEGDSLPEGVFCFEATGEISEEQLQRYVFRLKDKNIETEWFDGGDASAGSIQLMTRSPGKLPGSRPGKPPPHKYCISLNSNHTLSSQFSTLAHELGHLFLGHLGEDPGLDIRARRSLTHREVELEAESVAFVVSKRLGVDCRSHTYLANYVRENTDIDSIDIYLVMRAVSLIESTLALSATTGKRR